MREGTECCEGSGAHECPLRAVEAFKAAFTWLGWMFKADNWIAAGWKYVDTCQRKRFLCHWDMNRDSWLHLENECSVCKELNFADDLSGSEVPLLHFCDYIKYLCCKASGSVTAWLNSLPLYLSVALLCPSLRPVTSARTRFRGFQGKPLEELWRSRTCK